MSVIQLILELLKLGMRFWGASEKSDAQFLALAESLKDDSLISIQAHDKFKTLKEKLDARMQAEKEAVERELTGKG